MVDIIGDVLRNEAVEQHAKHILLEVPSVHAVAQVLRYSPYRLVQLLPLLIACCLSVFIIHEISPIEQDFRRMPLFVRDNSCFAKVRIILKLNENIQVSSINSIYPLVSDSRTL